jgi:hypothetical protein
MKTRIRPGLVSPLRNLSSFRRLRSEYRLTKAREKLESLYEDENSVFCAGLGFDDLIASNLTLDEIESLVAKNQGLRPDFYRLLDALSGSTGDIDALFRVVDVVTLISRFMGEHPIKRSIKASNAGKGNAAAWHKIAISRAAAIRKKHPDTEAYSDYRIAGDVFAELKDKPDGPRSVGTVDKHLRRKLWTNGVSIIK